MSKPENPEINQLLLKRYPIEDDRNVILRILNKYEALEFISDLITFLKSKKEVLIRNPEALKNTAGKHLIEINNKVKGIKNTNEKLLFKQIIQTIYESVFEILILPELTAEQLISLRNNLEGICLDQDYNFDDLINYFNIDRFIEVAESKESISNAAMVAVIQKPVKPKYFLWKSKKELIDFLTHLKDKDWIKKKSEMKNLFEETAKSRRVTLNIKHRDEILVLFDELTKKKFIQAQGTKGHFDVLLQDAVDFEGNLFIEKVKIKKHMDKLRKSGEHLANIKKQTDKLIAAVVQN
jgi:hypothetical protein